MAWRMWSKLCCGQKGLLFLFPLFLLFLAIFVMAMTQPRPLPRSDMDWRSSRALSSTGELRPRPRDMNSPPVSSNQLQLTHIQSRTRKPSPKDSFKHSVPAKPVAREDKNNIKDRGHPDFVRNKHKNNGIASKRKELAGANLSRFTVNNTGPKHRIKPSDHGAVVKHSARVNGSQAARWHRKADTPIQSAKLGQHHKENNRPATNHSGKSGKVAKDWQAVKKSSRDLKKQHNPSEEKEKNPGSALSNQKTAMKKKEGAWCRSFREQDFPGSDRRRIRVSAELQPWLSKEDIQKMELLAGGQVVSKARVPAHGQVLQVALDPPAPQQKSDPPSQSHAETHSERCQQGLCSLVKRTEDWFEVFSFHLDRVLGLNRSLPAVLRTFHSDILPYRYISGTPRPVVWWDPDIKHLADKDNDQNSVPLSWARYQKLLQAHCGSEANLKTAPCVGVDHPEWGRLALFDFLLQVNDRLDRYCCGFKPDPTDLCVENMLYTKCGNTKELLLVHILVRRADPSRLVFIDNAGRPQQSANNLNFRLVEGIDEFPENAVSVFQSGCLESLLLRSLYTDREFWDSQGGASGLRTLIHTVEQRGKILLQHIGDKKLHVNRDL
ncbi:Golgi-associated kinase 1A isoform X2 [Gymnodraco acuticeps]|nr:Golgi-associated kinase 1A isoform X2 [Gymnodraco acuticeps]